MDLEEVASASLGFAAFVAKWRKSPGLDLRWMTSPRHPTPRGRTSSSRWIGSPVAVRPLGTRAYFRALYSAGQDLRLRT